MSFMDLLFYVCLGILAVHLVIINIVAVVETIHDKKLSGIPKDSPKYWRVPENQLMLISALGGSVGMFLTMQTIRHKTQHPKFMIGIPVIMALQLALAVWIIWMRLA